MQQLISYQPLQSQRKFHGLKTRFKGFSGPIGSGKSAALCHEAIRLAYQNPGTMGLLGAPTYPMLRDATQRALLGLLEENGIPHEWHRSESYVDLLQCRSRVLLRSLDEYERLRGTNLSWFGVDELTYCKEEAWLRLEGRLREPKAKRPCGYGVWTPKGTDWVYRRFLGSTSMDYAVVVAKPGENRHVLASDPHFYERLRATYSDSFFRQEVLGEYVASNGSQVYGGFSRDKHIKDLQFVPTLPLLWTLDFNFNPFCTLICQQVDKMLHVLDELVIEGAVTAQMAKAMNEKCGQRGHGLVIYGDASGAAQQTNGPSNYKQLLADLGVANWNFVHLRVPKKNPPVLDRVEQVRQLLGKNKDDARIAISPRCHWLIADLEEVQFQQDGIHLDKNRNPKRTHISDALGYLAWEEYSARSPIGERNGDYPGPLLM